MLGFVGLIGAQPAATIRPFPDYDDAELLRAVPELAGIQLSTRPADLDPVLNAAGAQLHGMFAHFIAISTAEDIHEIRFEANGLPVTRRERFRYGAQFLVSGSRAVMDEFRTDLALRKRVRPPEGSGFLVLGHFIELLNHLLPEYCDRLRFRYVGRLRNSAGDWHIVAFAQRLDAARLQSHIVIEPGDRTAALHGLAWIDAATNRVARLHFELAEHIENFPFSALTTDITYTPVDFKASKVTPWLPSRATVHGIFAGGEVYTVHRFSDYRTFGEREDTAESGSARSTADASEDATEILARALSLTGPPKMEALQQAVHRDAGLFPARYQLAAALHTGGDLSGAERELREALQRVPDNGRARNLLGIVLYERGETVDAVAEFRASARLQPDDAVVQFNLGQALEKLGNRNAALEAYRAAIRLDPANPGFKPRLERLEALSTSPAQTTIRVEVRQVLVPVIVTDKAGHHITGLKQPDFRVFEDGVEQKITAFSSETTESLLVQSEASQQAHVRASQTVKPVQRTYVICLDTLHSAFENMGRLREALINLFRRERVGDSQYVLVAVGSSTKILQNTTSDPSLVLRSLEGPEFPKHVLDSRRNALEADVRQFRRTLDEVRTLCDARPPTGCEPRRRMLPGEAERIASQDRAYNAVFLQQLRDIVKQLSLATDRRTLILISDGFQLVPGKDAYALLRAYFPDMPLVSLRTLDRMQQEFDQVTSLAANKNIVICTVNSRGLYGQDFFNASNPGTNPRVMPTVLSAMNQSATDATGTLAEIADATGGTAFANNNDLLRGLQRALADGREYYSLSYAPSNSTLDGTFRTITVQMKDSRMVVKSKRGYWATAQ